MYSATEQVYTLTQKYFEQKLSITCTLSVTIWPIWRCRRTLCGVLQCIGYAITFKRLFLRPKLTLKSAYNMYYPPQNSFIHCCKNNMSKMYLLLTYYLYLAFWPIWRCRRTFLSLKRAPHSCKTSITFVIGLYAVQALCFWFIINAIWYCCTVIRQHYSKWKSTLAAAGRLGL